MQIGMIGLDRMVTSLTMRLMRGRHDCAVHVIRPAAVDHVVARDATGTTSRKQLVATRSPPRAI